MKKLILLSGLYIMFLSTISDAKQMIKIKPGSQISIKPNEETTVVCEGRRNNVLLEYCRCSWGSSKGTKTDLKKIYALYKIIILPEGKKIEELIKNFETDKNECEKAVSNHPVCENS